MQFSRPAGRNASVRKYDLLTALGAFALSRPPAEQRRTLRLMTLITARYNWAHDELSIGQREIARLWCCTERTVKRDFAALRARAWLTLKRQGARGHVSVYGLNLDRIMADTAALWPSIGPDFQTRAEQATNPAPTNVVALPPRALSQAPDAGQGQEWDLARMALHAADAALYGAWVEALRREGRAGGRLILRAPSRFHASYVATHLSGRILSVCQDVDSSVNSIEILH